MLYATERGCTHPGCTVPAYWCQVHHADTDWAAGGQTDIDNLTLACGPHNRLVKKGGWRTRKRKGGTTDQSRCQYNIYLRHDRNRHPHPKHDR